MSADDLKKLNKDKKKVKKLAKSSDILVHNFRPGVLERLGLSYEDLRAVNPQLIYCAISGYGRVGRLANRPRPGPNFAGIQRLHVCGR